MRYNSIQDIFTRIEQILTNKEGEPLSQLGSYIVGCTVVLDNIDDYYKKYPLLEEIAELGSELEVQDERYHHEYVTSIKKKMLKLKKQLPH